MKQTYPFFPVLQVIEAHNKQNRSVIFPQNPLQHPLECAILSLHYLSDI